MKTVHVILQLLPFFTNAKWWAQGDICCQWEAMHWSHLKLEFTQKCFRKVKITEVIVLTWHIYARLQERSEFSCVCVLGKDSKKTIRGSWKTRSYFLICSSQSCKKGLLTQMLQQLFEGMVMFSGIAVAVPKNPESPLIQPRKVLAQPYKGPTWNSCALGMSSRTREVPVWVWPGGGLIATELFLQCMLAVLSQSLANISMGKRHQ